MKRRLFKLALLLVAGAFINVAVTLVILVYGDFYVDSTKLSEAESVQIWMKYARPGWPTRVIDGERSFGFGGTVANAEFEEGDSGCSIEEGRLGWPFFGLGGARIEDPDGSKTYYGMLSMHLGDVDQIPWMPLWPGIAINTIFYATILWPLFAAPFAIRRWRRVARGRCPHCGYPVGASSVCTECGKAVNVQRKLEISS